MFGGVTKSAKGPVDELWKLDLTNKDVGKWTQCKAGKMKPLPRWHHTATFDGRGSIILFGGYSSDFRL